MRSTHITRSPGCTGNMLHLPLEVPKPERPDRAPVAPALHDRCRTRIDPPRRPHSDRLTGDLLDLRLEPLGYAFQVFEHLTNPRPLLEELLRLTRPVWE